MPELGAVTRPARPADYDAIAAVLDDWWGRPVLSVLPRVYLDHFYRTSLVMDGADGLVAFLIGFLSPAEPGRAYIHVVGVSPADRQRGLARQLYEEFFALARADGRRLVGAITSPVNTGSIEFHRSLGFTVTGPVADYDGPGRDKMVFERSL